MYSTFSPAFVQIYLSAITSNQLVEAESFVPNPWLAPSCSPLKSLRLKGAGQSPLRFDHQTLECRVPVHHEDDVGRIFNLKASATATEFRDAHHQARHTGRSATRVTPAQYFTTANLQ